MKKLLFVSGAILLFQFSPAQKLGKVTQGLSTLEAALWPNKTCAVCWENPSAADATERGWVRDAVASTWERESDFRTTGWGTCDAASKGVRIRINDERPVSGIGMGSNGTTGMVLNFTFVKWPHMVKTREYSIRVIAAHEFGHALGFMHEQGRTDAPKECQDDVIAKYGDLQGSNGDWWITPYDAESIMNYCSTEWSNAGLLTEKDKYGVRMLYGGPIIEAPIIYATDKDKNLVWYKHKGYGTGVFDWGSNKVGDGWNFVNVFTDGDGIIYAVKENGELAWYNHNGFHDGSFNWGAASAKVVGTGWNSEVKGVFAAGEGIIYIVKKNGDLLWYKHLGFKDGSDSWDPKSGTKVGSGWNDFHAAFSGGNGVIYMIASNGDLYWYKHTGIAAATVSWLGGPGSKIGDGWNSAAQVFSTGWGRIYLIGSDGRIRYYHHLGFLNGSATWGPGTGNQVGNGWAPLNAFGLGTIKPHKFIVKTTPDAVKFLLKNE